MGETARSAETSENQLQKRTLQLDGQSDAGLVVSLRRSIHFDDDWHHLYVVVGDDPLFQADSNCGFPVANPLESIDGAEVVTAYGRFLSGTLLITVIACLVAMPIGLAAAIYLSEYAPTKVRKASSSRFWKCWPACRRSYTVISPSLHDADVRHISFPNLPIFNALSAGIVVGIMIIPMVSSLSEDAMSAVPQ